VKTWKEKLPGFLIVNAIRAILVFAIWLMVDVPPWPWKLLAFVGAMLVVKSGETLVRKAAARLARGVEISLIR